MYNFVDTTEVSEGALLPSEALKINGEYIENLISGYRTLNVKGREALSPDVVSYTVGNSDGSKLKSRRFPERIITVKYQLIAESNEDFREAYNKLAQILNVEDAELIFNDEQDKFFKGTPCTIAEVEPGKNAVVSEFEILCVDPFKYSVVEYEATADLDENSILIDYNGTYKSYPILEADFFNEEETSDDGETENALTGNGDCGFVAFFTENEKIVQLGSPEEADGENTYAKSQTLINNTFNKSTGWNTAAKKQWAVNSGITSSSAVEQAGSIGAAIASYATATKASNTSGTLLKTTSKAEVPYVDYTVTAKATNRTANSVKVSIAITAALASSSNYFGNGFSLNASVYIGGAWRTVTLKKTTDYWRGKTGHTKNITVTISGLSASDTALTGIKFKAVRTDSVGGQTGVLGETACKDLKISTYAAATPASYYLKSINYGTGAKWHGASITRVIPADASGEIGAKNFTLSYSQKLSIGNGSKAAAELGAFQCLLVNGSGSARKIVAGVNVYKGSSGKKANLRFYVNGSVVLTTQIDVSYNNKYFCSGKSSTIKKAGETVIFNICGKAFVFRDSDISDMVVNEVTFTLTQYGTKTPLSYNGLYWAKFIKNNCDTWKDIPNKFSANDIVVADCKKGEIYLNGVLTPDLGASGNDWEDFVLTQGLNQIGFAYSEWVTADYAPTFKVRYREVFL
jgi:predicted phage tail component-like protein